MQKVKEYKEYKEQFGLFERVSFFTKRPWPEGPWSDEPDRISWRDQEFHCLMRRNSYGAWCGYVGVAKDHPCYKVGYSGKLALELKVHGGVTYADFCSEQKDENGCEIGICHTPAEGEADEIWWIGFDCHRFGDDAPGDDFSPARNLDRLMRRHSNYRTVEYVKKEIRSMIQELRRLRA